MADVYPPRMILTTAVWDTKITFIQRRKVWRLQVTHRPTGVTAETYHPRYSEAARARITQTALGTTPAGTCGSLAGRPITT